MSGEERPLQIIVWRDHFGNYGWKDIDERTTPEAMEPIINTTVGWLIAETDEIVKLSGQLGNNDNCDNCTGILQNCIISRETVEFVP